jgi:ubiquinone biosynthesis protein
MFVKLGQVMSTRSDLLAPPMVVELSRLQDDVRSAPRSEIEPMLEAQLGAKVSEVFAEFSWEPIAAASIGQAYRARLRTGEAVVVKVQRPGIAESVERDLDVLQQLAQAIQARVTWAAEYGVDELVDEFSARLREELDYGVEARNALEIGTATPESSGVRVPRIHTELSTHSVLVIEFLEGISVRRVAEIDALGVDRVDLAHKLLRLSLQQMLMDGRFHADPHPGNVFVLKQGGLGLIDFGAVGRLDPIQQSALRTMLFAVSQQDPSLLRQSVLDVATVRPGFDDDQFERALARFMAKHLGPGAMPTAAMFNDLLAVLFSSGISLPAEFSTFFRALMTLEGTLTTLSPGFAVIAETQTVAGDWGRSQLAPRSLAEFAREEVMHLAPILRRLPRQFDRLATVAARGDLRAQVSLLSNPADVRTLTKLLNRSILAFFGVGVGVVSVMLIAIKGGPVFTGQTLLYEFFGYFGLFCSSILIMRVLIAIFHDRLN